MALSTLCKAIIKIKLPSSQHSALSASVLLLNQRQQSTQEWKNAISAAEKLVGYPTSYLTLRSLSSDERSNVATHLRKLMVTTHPLVETAKQIVYDGPQTLQTRGLLVLLISKAMGQAKGTEETLMHHDTPAGVMHSQRSLAEITEMFYTSQLIHKGIVNLNYEEINERSSPEQPSSVTPLLSKGDASNTPLVGFTSCNKPLVSLNPDYEFGNKIAILCGDYLLAKSCYALAALQNSQVMGLVTSALADYTESEFIGYRDDVGRPMPSTSFDLELWREKTFLAVGALIAKSSKSALLLAGHEDPSTLSLVYDFSRHLAFAWQAQLELQPFLLRQQTADPVKAGTVCVTGVPVVLHLQKCCNSRRYKMQFFRRVCELTESGEGLDEFLLQEVIAGGAGVEGAVQVAQEHSEEALRLLELFPASDARTALSNMVSALHTTA